MPEKEIWTCENDWCTFSIGISTKHLNMILIKKLSDTTDKTHTQSKTELERHHKLCIKNYKQGKFLVICPIFSSKKSPQNPLLFV